MGQVLPESLKAAKDLSKFPGHILVGDRIVPTIDTATEAVRIILRHIGVDPDSDGLKDTPVRVLNALTEMTEGYREDPKWILTRVFEQSFDEVIILSGTPFVSICEHHLLVFSGTVDIGYIPSENGKVVGLSKLARLVDCFAKRLQIQERMTQEIANAIDKHLQPRGAAVVVRAEHSCMHCRGVRKTGTTMITSSMLGAFRNDPSARAEFLELCR
jgi:GTP cyclohydrolase I